MICASILQRIFRALDEELRVKNQKRSMVLMGGAAIMALAPSSRFTVDIDVADPDIDDQLKDASHIVAKKLDLPFDWLNSSARTFAKQLPPGWLDRCTKLYEGTSISIFSLNRTDLIKTKCLAYFDRQSPTDLEDLLSLKPTKSEYNDTLKWILSVKEDDEADTEIKEFFDELQRNKNK